MILTGLWRYIPLIFATLLGLLVTGCQKRYELARVEDYAIFGDELFLLINYEEGVDYASRFSHSAAFKATRRVLAVASCSLQNEGVAALALRAKRELLEDRFLAASIFYLSSTNSCIVGTGANSFEAVSLTARAPQNSAFSSSNLYTRLDADHIFFNADKTILFGCGKHPWVVDSVSFQMIRESIASNAATLLCEHSGGIPSKLVAVSGDLAAVVVQDVTISPPQLTLWESETPSISRNVPLPSSSFQLRGIQRVESGTQILASELVPPVGERAVLMDMYGQILWKAEMNGRPVSDPSYERVISVETSQALKLKKGDKLGIKVWLPRQRREFVLRVQTAALLNALFSRE